MNETTGEILKLGETFKFPALAETLKQIASDGVGTFYDGPIGDMLIDDVRQRGGILTKEDLRQYRCVLLLVILHLNKINLGRETTECV